MDCRTCRILISREIDGEAAGADRAGFDRHLGSCAYCASFRDSARRANAVHRAIPERAPSPRLVASILAATVERREIPRTRWWLRIAVPAAAAAVFVLGFWVGSLMHERYGGESASTLAGGAAGLELEYLDEYPPGSFGDILAASYEGGME
jgi:predicted anti-sigma-YlaC factor YlaD